MWNSRPPEMFAEPSIWRKYQCPRDSFAVSSTVKTCVPSGKWPQKMIVNAHTLRIVLAAKSAATVDANIGPVSAGQMT